MNMIILFYHFWVFIQAFSIDLLLTNAKRPTVCPTNFGVPCAHDDRAAHREKSMTNKKRRRHTEPKRQQQKHMINSMTNCNVLGCACAPSLLYLISLMNPKSSTNWLLIEIEAMAIANPKMLRNFFSSFSLSRWMYVIIVTFVKARSFPLIWLALFGVLLVSLLLQMPTASNTTDCKRMKMELSDWMKYREAQQQQQNRREWGLR